MYTYNIYIPTYVNIHMYCSLKHFKSTLIYSCMLTTSTYIHTYVNIHIYCSPKHFKSTTTYSCILTTNTYIHTDVNIHIFCSLTLCILIVKNTYMYAEHIKNTYIYTQLYWVKNTYTYTVVQHSDRKKLPPPGGFSIYYVPWSRAVCKRFHDEMRPSYLVVKSLTHGSWSGNIVNRNPPGGGGFFRSHLHTDIIESRIHTYIQNTSRTHTYILNYIESRTHTYIQTCGATWKLWVWRRASKQHTLTDGNTLQHTASNCNTRLYRLANAEPQNAPCQQQHTATHCNTLQHTKTLCNHTHIQTCSTAGRYWANAEPQKTLRQQQRPGSSTSFRRWVDVSVCMCVCVYVCVSLSLSLSHTHAHTLSLPFTLSLFSMPTTTTWRVCLFL